MASCVARSANRRCTSGLTCQCRGFDHKGPGVRMTQPSASSWSKMFSISCRLRPHRVAMARRSPVSGSDPPSLERGRAIALPKKRGLKTGDRVRIVSGLFAGRSGLCARVSREHIAVLLYILGAQRQVRLRGDAVEPAYGEAERCPLYPQKRTLELSRGMSALCQTRSGSAG